MPQYEEKSQGGQGRPVKLTMREYRLLAYLARNRERGCPGRNLKAWEAIGHEPNRLWRKVRSD